MKSKIFLSLLIATIIASFVWQMLLGQCRFLPEPSRLESYAYSTRHFAFLGCWGRFGPPLSPGHDPGSSKDQQLGLDSHLCAHRGRYSYLVSPPLTPSFPRIRESRPERWSFLDLRLRGDDVSSKLRTASASLFENTYPCQRLRGKDEVGRVTLGPRSFAKLFKRSCTMDYTSIFPLSAGRTSPRSGSKTARLRLNSTRRWSASR